MKTFLISLMSLSKFFLSLSQNLKPIILTIIIHTITLLSISQKYPMLALHHHYGVLMIMRFFLRNVTRVISISENEYNDKREKK